MTTSWTDSVLDDLRTWGQDHVVRALAPLDPNARAAALQPLRGVGIGPLIEAIRNSGPSAGPVAADRLAPPDVIRLDAGPEPSHADREAGREALAAGRVGWLVVAGGMGTRLGWDGPKGTYPIGPVTTRSLFQLFAEKLQAVQREFGGQPKWAIQTSPGNDTATRDYLEDNAYFGLPAESVRLFAQGELPAFDHDLRMTLRPNGAPSTLPDGHGGVFQALCNTGTAAWLEESGIDTLYYFQVDNPLVNLGDADFIGRHKRVNSQLSTKVVDKRSPAERVGLVARVDGTLRVVEYSELPDIAAQERNANGSLRLAAGNTAMHAIDMEFARGIGEGEPLPIHVARKPVPHLNSEVPGYKLERFVFDAIPRARNPLVAAVKREDEFAPVKNATGDDSPASARALLTSWTQRRLKALGRPIPRDATKRYLEAPMQMLCGPAADADESWEVLVGRPTG